MSGKWKSLTAKQESVSRLWGMRCKGGEKWGRVFKAKHHKCLHVTLESRISCVADGLVMCKLVSGLARGGGVSCTCGAPSWAMVSSCPCLCALYCSVISAILLARLGFISGPELWEMYRILLTSPFYLCYSLGHFCIKLCRNQE